jgi:hypothetical protein
MRNAESERAALEVTDAFMRAFNARDMRAHFDTFNFPHVRIASGRVRVFQTREELEANPERYGSREVEAGWARSRWDAREVIHAGDDKVHLAVQFTRYGAEGRPLNTYFAVYVVTRVDGCWGIQARSSFAP